MHLFSVDVCNIINEDRMFVKYAKYTVERMLAPTKFSIYRSLSVYLLVDRIKLGLLELFQNTVQEEFL